MADFVLVHGAWGGAWCWKRVIPGLWQAGHRAFAVTLTGVAERSHLLSPLITLDTHIADVLSVIEAEELHQAVLVGHSYAGMVVTGVADRLPEATRLGRLVYLDAVVPLPGESWSSGHARQTQAERRQAIAESGVIPPADPALFGLSGHDHAWVQRRQTPQPGGVYDAGLPFEPVRVQRWPRSFIDCTSPALATIALMRQRVRAEPGWHVVEIATGHLPMISAPAALLETLLALAR
ncbi:alpha/beta fold hydrolase [Piscinibacter sp. XHJ-5]|uniref:alpha/beta fold hydrolase n=1 Tax=Piscinibacter sp. XHJ-5 TaxID=3037797 RepID=UPI002452E7AB|nr:alpha/beta fold hydrolase [Piscinibacter sp. XHJ-5]